jgi:glucokinase
MRRAVLVNGVPASGKSSVARAVAGCLAAPLLTLDTVKEALFAHLGTGDREHNRLMGRASYAAIWAVVGEFPADAIVVVDAWFGFQPIEVLRGYLRTAAIGGVAEIWCHAPPDIIARRYADRAALRHSGHLGLDYVPELRALAARATPTGLAPVIEADTTQPVDGAALAARVLAALQHSGAVAANE